MRILFLIAFAGKAGTEKYVAERMEAYTRMGDSCLLAYDTAGPLSDFCRERGWPLLRLDMRPARILSAARELAAYCQEQGVEIIHAQYPRENLIGALAACFYPGVRVFFTSHLTIRQGLCWRIVNRWLTRRDAAVIAVCSQGAELLEHNGFCPSRVHVIFNGVEPCFELPERSRFRREYAIPPDTVLFLTLSRCAPEKGLDVLLESLARLKRRTSRPFCCVIAGGGEEYEHLTRRIGELGLQGTVIQAGYREDRDVLLASADVYVSAALYNEAMSYGILEAMGAGLPLAVTDVGAGPDLALHCGFVSPPGDAESMAENLLTLLEDDGLRRSLGRAARERAESTFSLSESLAKLHELYETAAE